MKTKEFIKKVDELGFKADKIDTQIDIIANGLIIAKVYTNRIYSINAFNFINIEWKNQDKLFDLIVEYARTPIEDREEEKKVIIQHKYLVSKNFNPVNLVWNKTKNIYRPVRCLFDNPTYQAQFTLKEIEEIKKKLDTDLKDFELVEVKDEDEA